MASTSSRVRAAILIKSLYANISHNFCVTNGFPHPVGFPAAGQSKMLAFAKLHIFVKHTQENNSDSHTFILDFCGRSKFLSVTPIICLGLHSTDNSAWS